MVEMGAGRQQAGRQLRKPLLIAGDSGRLASPAAFFLLSEARRKSAMIAFPQMKARQIHFAHANGFPSQTYRRLFELLSPEFRTGYLDKLGHDPQYPITDNWPHLVRELIDDIKGLYDRPIIGMGHSLGGVLHLMAACEEPSLYSSLVLLDSPVISPASSLGLKIMKRTGMLKRYPPASTTRFRRRNFADLDEARKYFLEKPRFAAFDPEVLEDYLRCGLVKNGEGLRLAFEPEIEASIYSTIPDHLPGYKGRLSVETFYIGGRDSREARLARLGFMKRHFPVQFRFVDGTHLFPMASPGLTARTVKMLLA